MINNEFKPEIIVIEDDNDYDTRGSMIEVHTCIVDDDFDNIGFEPQIENEESHSDNIFGVND